MNDAQTAADTIKARRAAEAQALIQKGMEYAIAEDKAFMADSRAAEDLARQGFSDTVASLATLLGIDTAHAAQTILNHLSEQGN